MKSSIKWFLMLIALIASPIYATTFQKLDVSCYSSDDVVSIVKRTVPYSVQKTFIEYTKTDDQYLTDTIRMNLLAIGKKESDWTATRSSKKNRDGTYDYGYLMLNENNISDPTFKKYFFPETEKYVRTNNQLYLAVCINYYKYLYNQYGCDASYAYNAGERAYIRGKLPKSTVVYKKDIKENLDMYIAELYKMQSDRNELKQYLETKRNLAIQELEKLSPLKLIKSSKVCQYFEYKFPKLIRNSKNIVQIPSPMYMIYEDGMQAIINKLEHPVQIWFPCNSDKDIEAAFVKVFC